MQKSKNPSAPETPKSGPQGDVKLGKLYQHTYICKGCSSPCILIIHHQCMKTPAPFRCPTSSETASWTEAPAQTAPGEVVSTPFSPPFNLPSPATVQPAPPSKKLDVPHKCFSCAKWRTCSAGVYFGNKERETCVDWVKGDQCERDEAYMSQLKKDLLCDGSEQPQDEDTQGAHLDPQRLCLNCIHNNSDMCEDCEDESNWSDGGED